MRAAESIRFLSLVVSFLLSCRLIAAPAPVPTDSLLGNGDFERSTDGMKPDEWPIGSGAKWEREGDNHFLRLTSPSPGANVMVYRAVPIPAEVKALEFSFKVRYNGIKRGKQAWFDGRVMMNFKDEKKEVVRPGPGAPAFSGTSAAWKESKGRFRVPPGATMLELMFTLFQAESGQIDFDDVKLRPVPLAEIEAAETAAAEKEKARIAALPKPAAKVPPATPEQLPKPLHVVGNQIQTNEGKGVWLQGLAVPSMEWSATGENILKSLEVGLSDWKANCIRLCVREDFWSGKGPYQKDGGMLYRQTVDDAVNLCASRGAYIVLDLHDYRAPEEKHAIFWKEVAAKYKNHPAVIFELLNEPHDISWEVWKNGGPVYDQKKNKDVAAENSDKLKSFDSIGMQRLVDVIRETGANNLIVAGGLDWSYDLSGLLNGFALRDANGNGIMYSTHVYPWKSDWQGKFLAAAEKYPIFMGEVGADTQKMSFLPADKQEDPFTWVPDILGVIQKHHLNWTAWCFHPKATPRVISDWTYTPTPFWGEFVKKALAGEHFEAKRLR